MEKVYIPFIINQNDITREGGINKLKKTICQTFAKLDENGSTYLGTVKKVEIIIREATKPDKHIISAFVRFVPSTSKAAMQRIEEIKSENGLKVTYDTKRNLFWVVLQQRNQKQYQAAKKTADISYLFESLTCSDNDNDNDIEPSRKRMRI
jgi:hypothetical protein